MGYGDTPAPLEPAPSCSVPGLEGGTVPGTGSPSPRATPTPRSPGGRALLSDARACMQCQKAKCSCSLSDSTRGQPLAAGAPPAQCARCHRLGLLCTPCAPRKRACAGCRAVKARCKWSGDGQVCDRCARLGQPCLYYQVKQRKSKTGPGSAAAVAAAAAAPAAPAAAQQGQAPAAGQQGQPPGPKARARKRPPAQPAATATAVATVSAVAPPPPPPPPPPPSPLLASAPGRQQRFGGGQRLKRPPALPMDTGGCIPMHSAPGQIGYEGPAEEQEPDDIMDLMPGGMAAISLEDIPWLPEIEEVGRPGACLPSLLAGAAETVTGRALLRPSQRAWRACSAPAARPVLAADV
eukprot:SAG22_NODE_398_length_11106_cov_67.829836_8_plen_351_part_00